MKRLQATGVVLGVAGCCVLGGCAAVRHDRPVRTTQPRGWERAELRRAPSGSEIVVYDRFELLYALGSVDPKTNLPREYVVMLSPEYIPAQSKDRGESKDRQPRPGRAVVTNTEPVVNVYQGYSYIWGRWPLVTTTRFSGVVEQFQGGNSRTIIWIDQAPQAGAALGGTTEIHRIFFLPESEQERLRVTLTEACDPANSEVVVERRAYVEVVRQGNCNRFSGPPVFAGADGWWNNPYIDNFVKTVLEQRENAGLQ